MVGGEEADALSAEQGLAQGGAVGGVFDRGIHFYARAFAGVVVGAPHEVVGRHFGCGLGTRGYHGQLVGCGDVADGDGPAVFLGEGEGLGCGAGACLDGAYFGVERHGGVAAGVEPGVGLVDGGLVFGVDGNAHALGEALEEGAQGGVGVDEHVACRRAHEQFHAGHARVVGAAQGVEVGVGGSDEEGVVGH